MSWLSNKQLCEKIRKNANKKTRDAFHGVYPLDELPKSIPHLPIFIIVNTQSHNLEGEHWKTIFIDEKRRGEVFDSLAQPMNAKLIQWINQFTYRWKRNHKVYQHAKSATCGAFALYFILNRLNYDSLNSFVHSFSPSINVNERRVCQFYKALK